MSFLDTLDNEVENLKKWLISEFGDHMSIHNATTDFREKMLKASAAIEPAEQEEKKLDEPPQS